MLADFSTAVQTADWRQQTFELYARVRKLAAEQPAAAHQYWLERRNELFRTHPASALPKTAKSSLSGLRHADYDPAYRFEAALTERGRGETLQQRTGTDGVVHFECLGSLEFEGLGELSLWRHCGYGGGLFLPFRDASSGKAGGSYGGGRYLLDTIKGAYLGTVSNQSPLHHRLVVDFNFAYNPSCAYDERWACPLPGPGNRLEAAVPVGELLS
ncbi:DUF1684 domain-containing protein [Psychromicrobium lacuslunae]|uniref:DUF1684 domain-containing protein n=1 Tax=Psychromicrobium lacuslunae TaxID=1618207 RepID=A0A0D4BY89_9MICC|nr:DUF1684 domain-containing protein [Psychromicrobium lacuslunae]AJT41284.1 hypothetical protein UM93_06685 [Psychromicrobium lacuslunae]